MAYYILKSYKIWRDPWDLFLACGKQRGCFFLDSNTTQGVLGRYSFIGIDPFCIIKKDKGFPSAELKAFQKRYKIMIPKCPFPFIGGAVGYLGYEAGFALEKKLRLRQKPPVGIPDAFFACYNSVIVIDHFTRKIHVVVTGFPEQKYTYAKALCEKNARRIIALLSGIGRGEKREPQEPPPGSMPHFQSSFTKEGYLKAVKKAKEYIRAGDIYQVNLSQMFRVRSFEHPLEIYGRLRNISPGSLSAYFDAGSFQLLSSSPERFISLRKGSVVTTPMKGTRPRSKDKKCDRKFKLSLLESAKDKAELMMIVDLERNDLGKVCDYGSIRVTSLRALERYNTVYQTTATITGRLYPGSDSVDLLKAAFPGGSITGCPKIRAMEIIDELEPVRRAIYTGSFGYLSFSRDMDFNIMIRTILKKGDSLYLGAGGGIVADSRPLAEYRETLIKASGMMRAIGAKI